MSDQYCPICYVNVLPLECKLKCGFAVCEECLVNWVKAEAKYEFIKVGNPTRTINDAITKQERNNYSNIIETIKCININCQKGGGENVEDDPPEEIEHRLTYEEWLDFIQQSTNVKFKEMYADAMLEILTPSSKTLQKCPRQGCDYVGYINYRNKCDNMVECEKCAYTWNDPDLLPFWKKLKKWCCSWNLNISLLNNLQKITRSQACPGCGICIIKGPGCKHMVCQKCRHEFCWFCLGDYPGYQHQNVLWCPLRIIFKVVIWLWLIIFTWNLKLIIEFPAYGKFMLAAGEFIGVLLLANIISLSIVLEVGFYALYDELKHSYNSWATMCRCVSMLFLGAWPCMWLAGLVLSYIFWDLAKRMAWYLLWQWVTIIALAIIISVSICVIKWISNAIYARRYQRYQQQLILEDNYYEPLAQGINDYRNSVLENPDNLAVEFHQPGIVPLPHPENMDNLEGLSGLFPEDEEEGYINDEPDMIEDDPDMIQDENLLATQKYEIRRKTLADIYLDSKLNRPRMASF